MFFLADRPDDAWVGPLAEKTAKKAALEALQRLTTPIAAGIGPKRPARCIKGVTYDELAGPLAPVVLPTAIIPVVLVRPIVVPVGVVLSARVMPIVVMLPVMAVPVIAMPPVRAIPVCFLREARVTTVKSASAHGKRHPSTIAPAKLAIIALRDIECFLLLDKRTSGPVVE